MKKVISIILVIALVACMLCVPAFASYREEEGTYINIGDDGSEFLALPSGVDFSQYEWLIVAKRGNFYEVYALVSARYVGCYYNNDTLNFIFRDVVGDRYSYSTANYTQEWSCRSISSGTYVVEDATFIYSNFDILNKDNSIFFPASSSPLVTADGRVYPDDFVLKEDFHNTVDAVDATLGTGLGMVNSVAKTIASSPLLFVCFAVGFIGIGAALFKRIRK